MSYDALIKEALQLEIDTYEMPMTPRNKGLYADKIIWINKDISTVEKGCVLAEELGHYHTSSGNILNQKDIRNLKQELRARGWAYEKLIPLSRLLEAGQAGIAGRHAIAEWLDVTEEFLHHSIEYYQRKYGLYATHNNFLIYFEPLSIFSLT